MRFYHRGLDRTVEMPASAEAHMAASGWVPAAEPQQPEPSVPEPDDSPGTDVATADPPTGKRRMFRPTRTEETD